MMAKARRVFQTAGWGVETIADRVTRKSESIGTHPFANCSRKDGGTRHNVASSYSIRKACTGLIDAARRAGMILAKNAHVASVTIATPRTSGSQPFTS